MIFRWSAIAARLPGRTDNEIKNVWHTHLKKRLEPTKPASQAPKRKPKKKQQPQPEAVPTTLEGPTTGAVVPVSPEQPLSTSTTSTTTDYSAAASSMENADSFTSEEEDYQIDDSFWSETLAMTADSSDDSGMHAEGSTFGASSVTSTSDDDMDFWLKLFMQASDMQNLAQI